MRAFPIVFLAVVVAGFGSLRLAAQDPEPERAPAAKSARSEVIRLRYSVASETASIVQQALPVAMQRRVRVIAEPRTNALVVSAEDADLKEVRTLVSELDLQLPEKAPAIAPPARKAAAYEIVLFMLAPGTDVAAKLPRTAAGVIDAAEAEAVLAKLRESIGQPGVTEVAKLSVTADDGRSWRWRQSAQVPLVTETKSGSTFSGYQEAVIELSVTSDAVRTGARRLGINGRIERFAESTKSPAADREAGAPPPKHTSNIEFASSVDDGKLVMSAVESAASKFDAGYVLFVRVKS